MLAKNMQQNVDILTSNHRLAPAVMLVLAVAFFTGT